MRLNVTILRKKQSEFQRKSQNCFMKTRVSPNLNYEMKYSEFHMQKIKIVRLQTRKSHNRKSQLSDETSKFEDENS